MQLKKCIQCKLGDVPKTFAGVDELISDYSYSPNTKLNSGITKFINWYIIYNNK